MTSLEKGDKLEKAVEIIERAIFHSMPQFNENAISIQPKKVVIVDGVRHEIDLYIEVDLGHGYKSVFIFECKNWEEKPGKNEIIIFSEKIHVVQAQKGYFVSREFGRYAKTQAKKDPRIELVYAEDTLDAAFEILNFHLILRVRTHVHVIFGISEPLEDRLPTNDLSNVAAQMNGHDIDFLPYINRMAQTIIDERLNTEHTETFSEGTYYYTTSNDIDLEQDKLVVNGVNIKKLTLQVPFSIAVVRPRIVSHYDIKTRGRIVQFDTIPIAEGEGEIDMSLISLS